jgi:hypothetical protein
LALGAWVLGLAVDSVGCKKLKTGAQEEFGRKYSCPDDRIQVLVPNLSYAEIVVRNMPMPTPPDEVKNDPGRLTKWQHDPQQQRDATRQSLERLDTFEVRGCEHSVVYGCGHPSAENGGELTSQVSCFEAPGTAH